MTLNIINIFKPNSLQLVNPLPYAFYTLTSLFSITITQFLCVHGFSYAGSFTFASLISLTYSMMLWYTYLVNKPLFLRDLNSAIQRYLNLLKNIKTIWINNLLILSVIILLIILGTGLDFITIETKQNLKFFFLLCMGFLCFHNLLIMISKSEFTHYEYIKFFFDCMRINAMATVYYTYWGLIIFKILLIISCLFISISFSLACSLWSINYCELLSCFFEVTRMSNSLENYFILNNQFYDFSSVYVVTSTDGITYDNFIFYNEFKGFVYFMNCNYLTSVNQFEELFNINMASEGSEGIGGDTGWMDEDVWPSPGGNGPSSGGNDPILPFDLSATDNSSDDRFGWWYELFDYRVRWHGLPFRCEDAFSGLFNMQPMYLPSGELIIDPVTNYWLSYQESAHITNVPLDTDSELFNTPLYSNSIPFGLYPSDNLNTVGTINGWNLNEQMRDFLSLRDQNYIVDVQRFYYPSSPEMNDQELTARLGDIFSRYRDLYHRYVWFAEHTNLRPGLNPFIFEHVMYFIERSDYYDKTVIASPNPTELETIVMNVHNFFELIYGQSNLNDQTCESSNISQHCIEQAIYVRETVTPINVTYIREFIPHHLSNMPQIITPGDSLNTTVSQMYMLIVPLEDEYRLSQYEDQVISHYLSSSVDNSPPLQRIAEVNDTSRRLISISSSPILQEVYRWGNPFAAGGFPNSNI